jgi:transposase InsO family protein
LTALSLTNGTRMYLHAVIDNFSRKILAREMAKRVIGRTTTKLLEEAAKLLGKCEVEVALALKKNQGHFPAPNLAPTSAQLKPVAPQVSISGSTPPRTPSPFAILIQLRPGLSAATRGETDSPPEFGWHWRYSISGVP